jgi:multidrug efflux pump subunit AcrB
VRDAYHRALAALVARRAWFIPGFLVTCISVFVLLPWLGQDFFPNTDSGQFILHMRAKSGTRIEETARLADLVEASIRQIIPPREMDTITDNIGLPYSTINLSHTSSGVVGAADADIFVSLNPDHRPTAGYVATIRRELQQKYPGVTFYSLPADMITQILNFGIPSPIDIQIDGANVDGNRAVANRVLDQVRRVRSTRASSRRSTIRTSSSPSTAPRHSRTA